MTPIRLLAAALLALPTTVSSVLASEVGAAQMLQRCQVLQQERWQGVTHYVVDQTAMGQRLTLAYERVEVPGPDGRPQVAFRPARSHGASGGSQHFTSDELRLYADAARKVGGGLSDEMGRSGLPVGLLGSAGQDPWASTDPRVMMGGAATFAEAAAAAQDAEAAERERATAAAGQELAMMQELGRRLRRVGRETIDSRPAEHFRATGLDQQVTGEGNEQMVIQQVDLWIDREQCVPLRLLMTGTMTAEGQTKPITIERLDSQYQPVAGSKMYEPRRQVMRMKGVLTPEQERQMAESQAKLADLDRQLAQMPPGQRDMIMRQMGPQLEMMRNMSAGGGFELVTEVHTILVNPDSAALRTLQASAASGGAPGFTLPTGAPAMPAAAAAPTEGAPTATAPDRAAQQACLQEKIRKRQEAQKKKQGIGRLVSAVGRMAGRLGGSEVVQAVGEAQNARATAEDLAIAARELGITEDEIATCQGNG
jgi:hypothetical protein